jgi:hypothetical protein
MMKIYPLLMAAMVFTFMTGMNAPAFANVAEDGADTLLMVKGGNRPVDDNPKPHGPLHKFRDDVFDDDSEDDMMLVRELEPRRGAEPPRKPGDPGLMGNGAGAVLAKAPGRADDAPKPHGPLHKFRDVVFDDDADDNSENEMILAKERGTRRPDVPPARRIDSNNTEKNLGNEILAREAEPRRGLDAPRRPGDPRLLDGSREAMVLAKARGRVDDAPKPHGPAHKFLDDGSDDMVLAREVERRNGLDAPRKPGDPRLLDGSREAMVLAKNKKPASAPGVPVIDAPIKNAPHAPGAVHG